MEPVTAMVDSKSHLNGRVLDSERALWATCLDNPRDGDRLTPSKSGEFKNVRSHLPSLDMTGTFYSFFFIVPVSGSGALGFRKGIRLTSDPSSQAQGICHAKEGIGSLLSPRVIKSRPIKLRNPNFSLS